jgi:hypothetical protein
LEQVSCTVANVINRPHFFLGPDGWGRNFCIFFFCENTTKSGNFLNWEQPARLSGSHMCFGLMVLGGSRPCQRLCVGLWAEVGFIESLFDLWVWVTSMYLCHVWPFLSHIVTCKSIHMYLLKYLWTGSDGSEKKKNHWSDALMELILNSPRSETLKIVVRWGVEPMCPLPWRPACKL